MSEHLSRLRLFQRHLRSLVWVWVWVWDWVHWHTSPRTRSPSSRHPPSTHHPFPPRSLVCGGQASPHKPRLVVSHSTCPPLSSSPHAHSFVFGTVVINTTHNTQRHRDGGHGPSPGPPRPRRPSGLPVRAAALKAASAVMGLFGKSGLQGPPTRVALLSFLWTFSCGCHSGGYWGPCSKPREGPNARKQFGPKLIWAIALCPHG
jgi:hypothetical protein